MSLSSAHSTIPAVQIVAHATKRIKRLLRGLQREVRRKNSEAGKGVRGMVLSFLPTFVFPAYPNAWSGTGPLPLHCDRSCRFPFLMRCS